MPAGENLDHLRDWGVETIESAPTGLPSGDPGDELHTRARASYTPSRVAGGDHGPGSWLRAGADLAWIKRFTARAVPGAYLRVLSPGRIQAGDEVRVVHTPAHDVTIGLTFRALTSEPGLLPRLLAAEELPDRTKEKVLSRLH